MQKEKQENRSCRPGRTHRAWKKNHLIFVFLLALMPWISEAQNNPAPVQYYKQPVRLSFGNQVVGFPFQNLFTSFHPGLMAGTEFGYNKSEKHRICQTLNLGFSFSRQIGNKVMLSSDFCYRYTHPSGAFAELSFGFGVLNQYHARETYKFNSSSGEYDRVGDPGKFGTMLGYGMGLGYDFSRKGGFPVSVFIKNTFFIQSPYFDLKDFPVMPQSTLQAGLTIKIRKHAK